MKLIYKDYILVRDNYCWEIIHVKKYNKLDKLGGVPTGEVGEKEENVGYYPLDLSIVLSKLATLLVEDADSIEKYLSEYERITQDLKQFIKENVTNTENSSN